MKKGRVIKVIAEEVLNHSSHKQTDVIIICEHGALWTRDPDLYELCKKV